jgi:hypothetical protein
VGRPRTGWFNHVLEGIKRRWRRRQEIKERLLESRKDCGLSSIGLYKMEIMLGAEGNSVNAI